MYAPGIRPVTQLLRSLNLLKLEKSNHTTCVVLNTTTSDSAAIPTADALV